MGQVSAEAIYRNFTVDATGTESLSEGWRVAWNAHNELLERAVRTQRLASRIESYWEGDAAGEAQRGLGPIVMDLTAAGQDHGALQDSIYQQSYAFTTAQDSVREVPPEPQLTDVVAESHSGSLVGVVIATLAMEHKATQRNEAAAHNVRVYEAYHTSSIDNSNRIPAQINTIYADNASMSVAVPRKESGPSASWSDPEHGGPEPGPGTGTA